MRLYLWQRSSTDVYLALTSTGRGRVKNSITNRQNKKTLQASIPDLQKTVPGSCRHSHSIISNSQTANTVVMSCQHAWNKDGSFYSPGSGLHKLGRAESTLHSWRLQLHMLLDTYQHGRLLVCPTRYSWSRHILPEAGGHSLRTRQRWCHKWCCRESRSWVPDRHAGQTACRWHHQSPWQKHCH